ncbi:glycosyltransferase [Serratia sp. TSA_198.1]|uniref:glycosyltransferase n=1 Tax=Serratia sp. TSA_198.1 TaxID=3415664 RepID=UPI004045E0F9
MKILHAAETIKGGVATVIRQIIEGQIAEDVNKVKCIIPSDQSAELSTVNDKCIVTFLRSGRNIISFFNFFVTFIKTVILFKPDLVHLHSTFSGVLGRLALVILWPFYRPKVVYCPHAFSFMMQGSNNKIRLYALLERLFTPITDAIICVSQHEKDSAVSHGLPAKKLRVVHNGVPDRSFLPGLPNPFQTNVINILFVGRFDYQKGFDILLDAMTKFEGKPIVLTAIGGAVHGESPPKEIPQTIYTGWLRSDELAPYFTYADVLVMPSRWEGFAMVALEAMSYGLPVLASNCSSFPEMIEHGYTGLLFEPENSKDLASYLEHTSKEKWQELGKNAREVFLEKYTAKQMIDKTQRIYTSLLSGSN